MDDEVHTNVESCRTRIGNAESVLYSGAFFPRSQNIIVEGGTFTSVTTQNTTASADFRRIPLGDLDLRREIRFDTEAGLVGRNRGLRTIRRMYSARIGAPKSHMTCALYLGEGAEEDWRQDLSLHSHLRHPNFVQIYATASSSGIYATIFHDDLIPFKNFLQMSRDSHFSTVHFLVCCDLEFIDARRCFRETFQAVLFQNDCTFWIRRSTGRLCVDLVPSDTSETIFFGPLARSQRSFHDLIPEAAVMVSLDLIQYHWLCYWHLRRIRSLPVSLGAQVKVGALIQAPYSAQQDLVEIAALLTDVDMNITCWNTNSDSISAENMGNGWTRYRALDVFQSTISASIRLDHYNALSWLSQANVIFGQVQITSNFEDYVMVDDLEFQLEISAPAQTSLDGYLFLCPRTDFGHGLPTNTFRWPDFPTYWSLDPTGVARLTAEEATLLGFPSTQLRVHVRASHWDESVYAGLRKFHEAKGFNPDSEDVARDLGDALWQIKDPAFTYVNLNDEVCWEEERDPQKITADVTRKEHVSERTQYDIGVEMLQFSWTGDVLMSVKASLILLSALHAVYIYLR